MNMMMATLALLSSLATPAQSQDGLALESRGPSALATLAYPDVAEPEALNVPVSMAAEPLFDKEDAAFTIGPMGGYLKARSADRGTWFGGVQARFHFARFLAVEAAISFHQNNYEDGDVKVTQYPLQLTAFLYVIPTGPFRPYILGGVGWYYTRVDYRDAFAVLYHDRTEHIFGEHLGAGAELMLGKTVSADIDIRYIFLNPSNDQVIHRDFNYWQATAGLNFWF